MRSERRNSILITRQYPELGSASDWQRRVGNLLQPIKSTTQIWVVTRHRYGIFALVSQTSFRGETSGGVAKCRLFFQARLFQGVTFTWPIIFFLFIASRFFREFSISILALYQSALKRYVV